MSILDWFRNAPRHDPQKKAMAEERMQRVMQGFQAELESLQLPAQSAEPGEMPAILSRTVDSGRSLDRPNYPWEKNRSTPEAETDAHRRY